MEPIFQEDFSFVMLSENTSQFISNNNNIRSEIPQVGSKEGRVYRKPKPYPVKLERQ